jgi:hypothetical protein
MKEKLVKFDKELSEYLHAFEKGILMVKTIE